MTDETEVLEKIGEPMASRPTKRDLIERGMAVIDPSKAAQIKISRAAGGITFANAAEIMQWAQLMSVAEEGVPPHMRAKVGLCLRIASSAVHWGMDPFGVGDKSYIVNGRLGWESQLVHAVIEARANLQHMLDCEYDGEGPTRTCTIIGMFATGDVRKYTSPMFKDIRVKNSALWKDDPDQQLFYYASRSWARKWCPHVLLGVYTREELASQPDIGREGEDQITAPGLHARLIGSPRSTDGHTPGHVERELETIGAGQTISGTATPVEAGDRPGRVDAPKPDKRTSEARSGGKKRGRPSKASKEAAAEAKADNVVVMPVVSKNAERTAPASVAEYLQHARFMIQDLETIDELEMWWADERKLRNKLGVTEEDRAPLMQEIADRRAKLSEK